MHLIINKCPLNEDFFSHCLQMETGPAEPVGWFFDWLFVWIFCFYLYFLVFFPEINFSNLDYFSLCSTTDKLRKELRIVLFSSPDQKNIFQFHKIKEKAYSFKIFYYFSDAESK